MTRTLRLFAILGILGLVAFGLPGAAESGINLPYCEGIHGTSCSSRGASKDCWWKKWGEPSVCWCQGTPLTWDCD